jgi:hypothetical protein
MAIRRLIKILVPKVEYVDASSEGVISILL